MLKKKVYVKGLSSQCDQAVLLNTFSAFGPVSKAFILYNHKTGSSRGFGFIEFEEEASVLRVVGVKVNIMGKDILVSLAVERSKGVVQSHLEKDGSRPN